MLFDHFFVANEVAIAQGLLSMEELLKAGVIEPVLRPALRGHGVQEFAPFFDDIAHLGLGGANDLAEQSY